ncbi:MAG TPA: RICIN domain-containing protein [Acidimicrobiia bacterium]
MSRRRALIAGALLGAGLLSAAAISYGVSAASTRASSVTGAGNLQIKSMLDTSFCVDVDESGPQPAVILSQCTAVASQRFTLSNGADGLNLFLDSRGRCLSQGPKLSAGFYAISVKPCTYRSRERWSFSPLGAFTVGVAQRCATVSRAAANVAVNLVPCQGTNSQLWKLAQ